MTAFVRDTMIGSSPYMSETMCSVEVAHNRVYIIFVIYRLYTDCIQTAQCYLCNTQFCDGWSLCFNLINSAVLARVLYM